MNAQRQIVWLLVFSGLLFSSACAHKKPPTLPPRGQAPTIGPQNVPDQIPLPNTEPEPTVTVKNEPQPAPAQTTPKKTRRAASSRKTTPPATAPAVSNTTPPSSIPAPAQAPASNPSAGTTVASVHPPQPIDTAIAPDVSRETASAQKQNTTQLLETTEKTVNGLNASSLSDEQKNMLAQIWSYINQSKKAETDGELERAYNLAMKAHLLSDALVKK